MVVEETQAHRDQTRAVARASGGRCELDGLGRLVSSVSPNSVPAGAQDTTITVTGSGFTSSSVVTLNSANLSTTYKSSTSLTATVPAADLTTGAVDQIGVSTPNAAASTTVPFQVNNPAPTLASISPSTVQFGTAATISAHWYRFPLRFNRPVQRKLLHSDSDHIHLAQSRTVSHRPCRCRR